MATWLHKLQAYRECVTQESHSDIDREAVITSLKLISTRYARRLSIQQSQGLLLLLLLDAQSQGLLRDVHRNMNELGGDLFACRLLFRRPVASFPA
jgi:hypothetical protein